MRLQLGGDPRLYPERAGGIIHPIWSVNASGSPPPQEELVSRERHVWNTLPPQPDLG